MTRLTRLTRGGLRAAPLLALVLLALWAAAVYAQDSTPTGEQHGDPSTVPDDKVNEVAAQLYCPVCEGIPLDACATTTCVQWKEEIRQQIADGWSDQQIIDAFVQRFGDKVVGVPQDLTLQRIALIFPWVAAAAALIIGTWTFLRWRRNRQGDPEFEIPSGGPAPDAPERSEDDYRSRLEQDLMKRR